MASGHGGIDWLVCRAFTESVKRGVNKNLLFLYDEKHAIVAWFNKG